MIRLTGKFHGAITPTTPLGWNSIHPLAPSRPSGAVTGRRSGRDQRSTCLIACLSGATEAAMSVTIDCSRLRWPKSSLSASQKRSALSAIIAADGKLRLECRALGRQDVVHRH